MPDITLSLQSIAAYYYYMVMYYYIVYHIAQMQAAIDISLATMCELSHVVSHCVSRCVSRCVCFAGGQH